MLKKSLDKYLIFLSAVLIMFLPRRVYIAGVFSFRAVILCLLLLYIVKNRTIKYPRALVSPFIAVYFTYSFLDYVFTLQITSGIGFLVDSVVLIILITSLIRDQESLNYFIDVFNGMLTIYAILGLIEVFAGINIYDVVFGSIALQSVRFGLTRFCGAGLVSSNNANFLLLASILIMYRIINCDSMKEKKRFIVAYIMNTIALFFTLTRASILLFLALQLIWLIKAGIFMFIEKHLLKIVSVMLVLVSTVIFIPQINSIVTNFITMFHAFFDASIADSISSSFGSNAQGTGERFQLYEWVAQQIKGSELFGKGANTPFIHEYTTWYGKRVTKISLENHYLMMYYQLGIVGLVTFLSHYFYMLFYALRVGKRYKNARKYTDLPEWNLSTMITWGFIIMFPAMFVTGLFDELRMIYLMFALVISYNSILKKCKKVTKRKVRNAQYFEEEHKGHMTCEKEKSISKDEL